MIPSQQIGVLGGGSFGTVLADLLARKGHSVTLWAREAEIVDEIIKHKKNSVFLPEFSLAPFAATTNLKEACTRKELLLFAIPTQFIRPVLLMTKEFIPHSALLVNAAKGIEQETLQTPSGIFCDVLGKSVLSRYAVLSGPTFAKELAEKHPTAAVIVSQNKETALRTQQLISVDYFRLYTSPDVLGVELGGALKNVMAIGTGIAEGLGFGLNTRAGFITRCLYEMTKLGATMGADPLTFSGLSGLGDLVLTCTGELSRNRFVGMELGKGKKLPEILQKMKSVAEGIATTRSAYLLAQKYHVDMPNTEHVYRILYENLDPLKAVEELRSRELKEELAGL